MGRRAMSRPWYQTFPRNHPVRVAARSAVGNHSPQPQPMSSSAAGRTCRPVVRSRERKARNLPVRGSVAAAEEPAPGGKKDNEAQRVSLPLRRTTAA